VGVLRYAITGGDYRSGDAERWAGDGVDFVQLRAKTMDAGELVVLAREMIRGLGGNARLLVNGRADVAIAAGAAGVHLTAHPDELTPEQVRQVFSLAGAGRPVVSISCHTLAEVDRARDGEADLILFAPVFEKRVGADIVVEGSGLEMLGRACAAAAPVKVLALGGVTQENAQQCIDVGAAGVAGIRLFG
jgi:thiamine-phosphate pyrophosphorylase